MTLVEFFESGYFLFFYTVFGFILVLGTFMISLLRTQKLPIAQLCLTALFVLLIFYKPLWSSLFKVKPESSTGNMSYDLFVLIIATIVVIADHLVYLLGTSGNLSRKSLFVLAPDKTGKLIYIYQDHKGRVALYNKYFYEALKLDADAKKFKKTAQNYIIDNGNYLYKDFLKKLAEAEEGVVKFVIQFEDHDAQFVLEKIRIEEEGSLVGFIFVETEEMQKLAKEDKPAKKEESVVAPLPKEDSEEEKVEEEEEPAEEEEPKEEEPAEEEEPKEEEPVEAEEPKEEAKEDELSMDDLNKVDLDNSFLDDDEEKK